MVECNVRIDVPQPNWHKVYDVSLFGGVGQCVMTELLFPSLTGTKTDCLFGKVGFIFCVLIKALWLTSPTGSSKQLVHAEIALSFFALLGLVT